MTKSNASRNQTGHVHTEGRQAGNCSSPRRARSGTLVFERSGLADLAGSELTRAPLRALSGERGCLPEAGGSVGQMQRSSHLPRRDGRRGHASQRDAAAACGSHRSHRATRRRLVATRCDRCERRCGAGDPDGRGGPGDHRDTSCHPRCPSRSNRGRRGGTRLAFPLSGRRPPARSRYRCGVEFADSSDGLCSDRPRSQPSPDRRSHRRYRPRHSRRTRAWVSRTGAPPDRVELGRGPDGTVRRPGGSSRR